VPYISASYSVTVHNSNY